MPATPTKAWTPLSFPMKKPPASPCASRGTSGLEKGAARHPPLTIKVNPDDKTVVFRYHGAVKSRAVRVAAVIVCLLVLLPAVLSPCRNPGYVYSETGAIECGGNGQPITLARNPDARDPTFAELMAFIEADTTDRNPYVDGEYVCADFARDVYNNAQAAGIRAGWVGLRFGNSEVG